MPRTARLFIKNALYHVISRGNQKQVVFHEKEDYEYFLTRLKKYKAKYNFRIYAYCLMDNHIHLLIDPGDKLNLTKVMHGMNTSYAMWFNNKYGKCGHVWQDRFKSFVIQKDDYLLNCVTYIEYNPVRKNICLRVEEYPWCSYGPRTLGFDHTGKPLLDVFVS
jgi:putative transposase